MTRKKFTFNNVRITISAPEALRAYADLCNGLSGIGAEWDTDTYSQEGVVGERSTVELFPEKV